MTGGPRWSRAPRSWRATLRGVVVADGEGTQMISGSAAAVWDLLDAPLTDGELEAASRRTYGLDSVATRAGLQALAEAGLCTTI